MAVESELKKFGLHPISVELGIVEISENLDREKEKQLNLKLVDLGFEIIDDRKSRVV